MMVVQILPPAVFAGALHGSGNLRWGFRRLLLVIHWILLAMLAFAAYALPSHLILANVSRHGPVPTGRSPTALVDSARAAQSCGGGHDGERTPQGTCAERPTMWERCSCRSRTRGSCCLRPYWVICGVAPL